MPPPQKKTTAQGPGPQKSNVPKVHKGKAGTVKPGPDGIVVDELDAWIKAKQLIRPEDQLELSEQELKEEIARVLTTNNPQIPSNIVEFSFKEGCFVPVPPTTQTVLLLDIEGTILHRDSEEARNQLQGIIGIEDEDDKEQRQSVELEEVTLEEEDEEKEKTEAEVKEGEETGAEEDEDKDREEESKEKEKEEGEEGAEDEEGDEGAPKQGLGGSPQLVKAGPKKKLTNQFNFCERATLTYNNAVRSLETQTIPPPRATFSANVTQWIIYDAYQNDFEAQQREKEKEKEKKEKAVPTLKPEVKKKDLALTSDVTNRTLLAVKTLERMINQNTYDDIAQDYRYWEDPSDEYRDEEGTLLPLWKFVYEKTKKNNVTDLVWSPTYYDLFAVAFGSFDFMKPQSEGAMCLFTLKNPSFPEYVCTAESGVVCVDIHPVHPYLICIGKYDGNVAVYDVHLTQTEPQYESNSVTNKHCGIVWQVHWGVDMPDGEVNFFSVSADGNVYNWVLTQHELTQTLIISLFLSCDPIAGPDGTQISMTGCGTTITFHPTQQLIFLIGTEEGNIYKCSTAYASLYLATYEAHHMPVYKIDYNKFYPDIFISCSADWRVKIWEDGRSDPLFVFDLGCAVGDVEWAPHSSTVFAAVTNDGKVHVFDLNINKYRPICIQSVVSKRRNKLTRIAFNNKLPIIIVGDDRGCVTSLKLSPNLRKKVKPPKKGPTYTERELELMKLEKLLALVREPPTLTRPPDLPTPVDT
ncbi:dynein intermediate chain 2, ciliary [Periplaneta americana]|uniref:dynein intermediate chain 2, ciliary n=1 Tax=Periplaneta americana TaxID=6978 RepID=UPI0037E88748